MQNDLKENIVKFTRLISSAEEDAKGQYAQELTATQLNYLEIIGELHNPTITELASAMGLTKPSVTIVVDRLVAKGFVRKVHSDTDKRSSHLHLTELGDQINKRHDYAHDYVMDRIEKKLDKNEVKSFTLMLDKITNIMLMEKCDKDVIAGLTRNPLNRMRLRVKPAMTSPE